MMIHEQQIVLFFTANRDQCMQVLLAGTAGPQFPLVKSSDGKQKPSRKKKPNCQVTARSPLPLPVGMIHRGRAALPRVTTTTVTTGKRCVTFQISGTYRRERERKKKGLAPTMHLILQHNPTRDCGGENKTTKRKQKSNFQCVAPFHFVLRVEGKADPVVASSSSSSSFKHSPKAASPFTQVAPRLPLRRAARGRAARKWRTPANWGRSTHAQRQRRRGGSSRGWGGRSTNIISAVTSTTFGFEVEMQLDRANYFLRGRN